MNRTLQRLIMAKAKRHTKARLAHDALRYEAVRSLQPHQFLALIRSVINEHAIHQSYESAFDQMVDKVVISNAHL